MLNSTFPPACARLSAMLLTAALGLAAHAQHRLSESDYTPKVAPASNEGELAIKRFTTPPGLKIDLFAAEPDVANIVGFGFDEKGRCFVAETFRHSKGVMDIRGIMSWLNEDLACRTVSDRLKMMKRHLGEKIADFTTESERVKLLEDRNGDGQVDHSTVFADQFNTILDGIGASVLARHGDVYFANIPNLWLLRDADGDGTAEFRQSLHYGFGVRIGFLGHDLHGLRFGPDGKLYFSIGDRGSNIQIAGGRTVGEPDTGCVFRCSPDGSELEVFALGLRNPQGLAFDDAGNLFTGDNNSDSGDKARWVYVVEGGDSGWRVGFQSLEGSYSRGPWNAEKLWYPQFDGQAAYIVPPITNITDGPSGVSFNPGTGLPDSFRDHFFLVDFRGSANSGVHSLAVKPRGASFELVDYHHFFWQVLATDCQFGVDGGLYVSDWVQGWDKTGKGRIYRVHDPAVDGSKAVLETKKLLAEGMAKRSNKELAMLLAQPDQRVRQEAQFALAERGIDAVSTLSGVARKNESPLARRHAIWGIGQIGSKSRVQSPKSEVSAALDLLVKLLADEDAEVRAQAAKVLGEQRFAAAYDALVKSLNDPSPRVRFFATMSLGKLGRHEAIPSILALLRENADRDPYLRHAGVMALAWINDVEELVRAAKNDSRSVRMGAMLALRRLERPEISVFLGDTDSGLVVETARAINDVPISGAIPELAALIGTDDRLDSVLSKAAAGPEDPKQMFLRRLLNANFRFGTAETASSLARFAARNDTPELMRIEALVSLGDWPTASGRDRVTGLWRPTAFTRDTKVPADAARPVLSSLLQSAPDKVRVAAARTAGLLGIMEAAPVLSQLIADATLSASIRIEALKALAALKDARLADAVKLALADSDESVRKEASRLQASIQPSDATGQLAATLTNGTVGEKQAVLATLGGLPGAAADQILLEWLEKLVAGQVPKELQLDVLEAAGKRSAGEVRSKLEKFAASQPKDDGLAGFREALYGGNAADGRKVFFERQEVQCVRCHKINGEGGDVGPDLSKVATQKDRAYILESILNPNKNIAAGFESVIVSLKNGTVYAGVIKSENGDELVINSPEDGVVTVRKSDIQARDKGLSAMPEGMGQILSKQDLRNLVEFLGGLK